MTPLTANVMTDDVFAGSASTAVIAARSEPAPESLNVVTDSAAPVDEVGAAVGAAGMETPFVPLHPANPNDRKAANIAAGTLKRVTMGVLLYTKPFLT